MGDRSPTSPRATDSIWCRKVSPWISYTFTMPSLLKQPMNNEIFQSAHKNIQYYLNLVLQ